MTLSNPEWLVAWVLLPALLVGAILAGRLRNRAWRSLVARRLQSSLLRVASPIPRWLALAGLMGALVCLIAALARPQGEGGERTESLSGRNLLIALDLSHSMNVKDALPSRLDQAKAITLELLDSLPDDRVGVIAFAGTPYLVAPITIDHGAVRETVQQLDTSTIPTGGSNLASAVEMAIKVCNDSGSRSSALVVISDGEEHDGGLSEIAQRADREGMFIFTIGVGTEIGDFIPDPLRPGGRFRDVNDNPVVSSLQQESLRLLASETGGRYVHAASGAAIGPMVESAIADLQHFEVSTRTRTIAVEFFQWFLTPAVLLLMASIIAGTNWRSHPGPATVSAAVILAALPPAPTRASPELAELSSLAADATGERRARYRLAEGTTALAEGDHRTARFSFSEALLSDDPAVQAAAHHNMGNNLLAAGWEALSEGEAYPDGERTPVELRKHVVRKLTEWMEEETDDDSVAGGYRLFESVMLDWADAVRHYDSALQTDPANEDFLHNRQAAARLLELLRDSLEQTLQQQQQMRPNPGQGEQSDEQQPGDPQPGEGDPQQQPGDQDDQQQPGEHGDQPPEQDSGPNADEQSDDPQAGDPSDEERPSDRPPREGESPEEQARRLLRENADFEQGPLIRSRRFEHRRPDKDW